MKICGWFCVMAFVFSWPLVAIADKKEPLSSHEVVKLTPPAGVRIGAWLTQNHPELSGRFYQTGWMWTSQAEAQQQSLEKVSLLNELTTRAQVYPQRAVWLGQLKAMLTSMPVTGRKSLNLQDPWLMQAHPANEPVAIQNDEIVLTGRPDRVRVITPEAQWCDVKVQASRSALDYVQACGIEKHADTVWLIQPDGQVSHLKVAEWNAQTQEPPAPGAWIWVPPSQNAPKLSLRIAKFIATQGVAQGPQGAQGPNPPVNLSAEPGRQMQNMPATVNDWGTVGLLQTPSARSPEAGHVSITAHRVWPYTHTTLSLSPFDSLELGFRYTNITNRLYGPSIAGDQGYKDKSAEIKWRMREETEMGPAVAVGLRDPGGTGLFAGEYLVASKRWNNLDLSLGLGWGYLGARGNLTNPLKIFGQRFAVRQNLEVGSGGTAHLTSLFTGRTALFGGVQWQTPYPDLVVKAELDGNDYKNEPLSNNIGGSRSPVNWGMAWQTGPLIVSLGYERGQEWMLGLSLSTDLAHLSRAKINEVPARPVTRIPAQPLPRPEMSVSPTEASQLLPAAEPVSLAPEVLQAMTAQTGWSVHSVRQQGHVWTIELNNVNGYSLPERMDRGMGWVHEIAPEHIQAVKFVLLQQGVPVSSRLLDRVAWAEHRLSWQGHKAVHESVPVAAHVSSSPTEVSTQATGSVGLGYQQHLGGPDGYLFALNATTQGQWPLWPGAWAQGSLNARLVDNYNHYHYTAPSSLPRVRTWIREYLTSERITLPLAQINQLNQWGDGLYSLAYAGALEPMFAGVGAEVLWRPLGERWALGADLNRLAQRDFDQRFSLRDYRVNSGHLTAYWDTRWLGVEAKVMLGQYLAGDRGATFEISRRFANGARMGAWLTKTNVSSSAFGEGSFDKGVYVSIPFDAFLTAWSTQSASLVWQPLIRDGGARLNKAQNLWGITNSRDEREWTAPATLNSQ